MSHWYFKDGTIAVDAKVGTPKWIKQMGVIEKKLGDIDYKRVAETTLPDGKWVSTVWIGLDYNLYGMGKPLIFETMVFSGKDVEKEFLGKKRLGLGEELDVERYSTLKEAEKGHKRMVRKWTKK